MLAPVNTAGVTVIFCLLLFFVAVNVKQDSDFGRPIIPIVRLVNCFVILVVVFVRLLLFVVVIVRRVIVITITGIPLELLEERIDAANMDLWD